MTFMRKPNSKEPPPPPLEQMAADALNEQGFLLAQVVREKIRGLLPGDRHTQSTWAYVEGEYPVTAVDGSQTRIDLVLRSGGVHLCLECKRPHPQFKRWVFFDKQRSGRLGFETYQVQQWPMTSPTQARHAMDPKQCRPPCSVFSAYLEVAMKRSSDGNWKASHTETVEEAFRQVVRGHTGLMAKLMNCSTAGYFWSIPVVVTTAEMYEAQFDYGSVRLADGMIDQKDLKLVPVEFCAVNYHADDKLALNSQYMTARRDDIQTDLWGCQIRSVFVVHAEAINRFLIWLHKNYFSG